MGTRSLIGIEENGVITFIYCNYDSAPRVMRLNEYFRDTDSVKNLISKGSVSSILGGCPEYYMYRPDEKWSDNKPRTIKSEDFLEKAFEGYCCDYAYIFKDGKWEDYSYRDYKESKVTEEN